jgi:hypothetical protein
VMSGTLTEQESERARGRAEWAGHAQVAADIAAGAAVDILLKQPEDIRRSFVKFAGTGVPVQSFSVMFHAWLRSGEFRMGLSRGFDCEWDDPELYALGKLIESLGYRIPWHGAPPGVDNLEVEDFHEHGSMATAPDTGIWDNATMRAGGVPIAYDRQNPLRLHTAVAPNREAFDRLFVRLKQIRDMEISSEVSSSELAQRLRDTPQGRDMTMSEIWGAVRYAAGNRFFREVIQHGGVQSPVTGERSDSGVLYREGHPVMIRFDTDGTDGRWSNYQISPSHQGD